MKNKQMREECFSFKICCFSTGSHSMLEKTTTGMINFSPFKSSLVRFNERSKYSFFPNLIVRELKIHLTFTNTF